MVIAHSLMLEHCSPSPAYPTLHLQEYDPIVLLHAAFGLQLCPPPATHSLMSVHLVPAPDAHARLYDTTLTK